MAERVDQPAEATKSPGAAQAAHPRCADPRGASLHRRGQAERAGPGDHPSRRRRDGFVLQPLRQQGRAVRTPRVNDVLDAHGALLDRLTESIDDPAETFACSFRLTGRLFRRRPQESRVLRANGVLLTSSDRGLAPRALRDINAAIRANRFRLDDPTLALALAGGALLGLGQLLADEPHRNDARAADRVAEDLLRLFGMDADEARDICQRPLPDLDRNEA